MTKKEHPFYGYEVIRIREQELIEKLLKKYRNEPADDNLKRKVWDDLQEQKHLGKVTIPFKVELRRDATGKFPSYIEVILDTKV